MERLGELLQKSRKELGYSLRDAEEITKIRIKYLEALENEEFNKIPGEVYALGFLRTYAKFLGLNQNEIAELFKTSYLTEVSREQPQPTKIREKSSSQRRRINPTNKTAGKKGNMSLVIGISILLIVISLVLGSSFINGVKSIDDRQQETDRPAAVVPRSDNTPQPDANPTNPPNTNIGEKSGQNGDSQQQTGVTVTLKVIGDKSWVVVKVDGKDEYNGMMLSGDVRDYTGQEKIWVKLGNAGAVEVVYNDENLGVLGGLRKVVTKEFRLVN